MADDAFGFLNPNIPHRLTPPEGYEAVHKPGMTWPRQGSRAEDTSWITVAQWTHFIAQFRGLLAIQGVDLSDLDGASPFLLREALMRGILAALSNTAIADYGLLDKATYDPDNDGVIEPAQGGTGVTSLSALYGALGIDNAISAAVQAAVSNLIGDAPDALNDFNELAAALNDDENFAATIIAALAEKLSSAAGAVGTDNLADKAVTLAKLASGQHGKKIGFSSAGDAVLIDEDIFVASAIIRGRSIAVATRGGFVSFVRNGTGDYTVNFAAVPDAGKVKVVLSPYSNPTSPYNLWCELDTTTVSSTRVFARSVGGSPVDAVFFIEIRRVP